MTSNQEIIYGMIQYNSGDPKRIQHFMKVFEFASLICEREQVDPTLRRIIEITAITHDIGIKKSEAKYQSSSGHYQQIEGPAEARLLLERLGIEESIIAPCCWLIAHHHTYDPIERLDHQIIVEADFLVNIFEEGMKSAAIDKVKTIFKTKAGIELFELLYTEES